MVTQRLGSKPAETKPGETPTENRKDLEEATVRFKQDTSFAVNAPVTKNQFTITYDGPFKTYVIEINATSIEDYRSIKLEAEKEFKNLGVTDLCALKILYIVPKEIRDQANQSDLFASTCKAYL